MEIRVVAVAGLLLVGMLTTSGCGNGNGNGSNSMPGPQTVPLEVASVGGYEGWWNGTPVSGDTSGLPDETVAVRTETGEIVDASARDARRQAAAVPLSEVEYTVEPDRGWPSRSVVIIDTATGEVIDSFPVDSEDRPTG